jgi:hypothetical protein
MSIVFSFDLSRVPRVDHVGIEERAAALGKRSIEKSAKRTGIRLLSRAGLGPGPA